MSQINGVSQQSIDGKKDFAQEAKLLLGAIDVRFFFCLESIKCIVTCSH